MWTGEPQQSGGESGAAAVGPDKILPAVGAGRSAVAVHAASRPWLSFFR